jgi:hypothetical protein
LTQTFVSIGLASTRRVLVRKIIAWAEQNIWGSMPFRRLYT